MASVKMLKVSAGPAGCFHPGTVRNVSPEEGAALVRAGAASWVERPVVEAAVVPERENAALRTRTKKAGRK